MIITLTDIKFKDSRGVGDLEINLPQCCDINPSVDDGSEDDGSEDDGSEDDGSERKADPYKDNPSAREINQPLSD